MPQSWRTALLRHHKTERRGTNNDKTNATYEITDARTKKICNWGATLERSEKSTGSGFWVRICNTYEYVTDMLQLYAYVTVTYVYECHMSNLTRVQTTRTLHILYNCKEKSIQLASVDRTEGDWSELRYQKQKCENTLAKMWKISDFFLIWKFSFFVVKFQYIWIGMFP